MGLVGIHIDGQCIPFDQITPDILAPEIVNALAPKDRGDGVHVSDLTGCPYKASRSRNVPYYWSLKTAYRVARGTLMDVAVQQFKRDGALYQQKYVRTVNGIPVEGTADVVDPVRRSIEDVKMPARAYTRGVPDYYVKQLNAYFFLSYPVLDFEVEHLYLDVYGPVNYEQMTVPIWNIRDTSMWLRQRVAQFQTLLDRGNTEPCSDPSCWLCHSDDTIWV